eukprot:COSAG01_NODE_34550_length_545_cov_5.183857_1_plen_34_part_01
MRRTLDAVILTTTNQVTLETHMAYENKIEKGVDE